MPASAGWFNDADYSDLTFKLQDGRELKVHKLVICKENKYFDLLCGATSSFKKSNQKMIELIEDDADAVEEIIRRLYGCTLPPAYEKSWRFWHNLIVTADKYLATSLSYEATTNLRTCATKVSEAETVLDIMLAIDDSAGRSDRLWALHEELRKKNLEALLKNERYRELLARDKELVLKHLDELAAGGVLTNKLEKKQYFMCQAHASMAFHSPNQWPLTCFCCDLVTMRFGENNNNNNNNNKVLSRVAYLPGDTKL